MANKTIVYTEEMVGSGHPSKPDTLNRLTLVEHKDDGTHKHSYGELYELSDPATELELAIAGTFYKWGSSTVGETAGVGLVVGDVDDDDLTIGVDGAGLYKINAGFNIGLVEHNTVDIGVFVNDVRKDNLTVKCQAPAPPIKFIDTITVNAGSIGSGSVNDIQKVDGDYLVINEVSATPGFDVEFEINTPIEHTKVIFWGRYDGSTGHEVEAQAYNYTTAMWVDLRASVKDLPNQNGLPDYVKEWAIPSPQSDFTDGVKNKMRFYHTSAGSGTHFLNIDKLVYLDKYAPINVSVEGLVNLVATDVVDLRIASNITDDLVIIHSASITIQREKI